MTNKTVTKNFIRFVSRNILGMLGVSCYVLADTFFISRGAGADGITVLNLCLPIYALMFAIGSMIGVGSATRYTIAKAKGEEASAFFGNGLLWCVIFGLVFTMAGLFAPDAVLAIMGGDEGIVALGQSYARIFMCFAPFFMMNYVFNAFARNDDAPTLAMAATLGSSLFNIVFDYIFMFPLGMGLAGAALATGISPILSIIICSTHLASKKSKVKIVFKIPSFKKLAASCQLGISAFVGEFANCIVTIIFNFLILAIAGNTGVAAYGVVANLSIVAFSIFNGISLGCQPILSDYYGQNDKASTALILRLGLGLAVTFAAITYLFVFIFANPLVAAFNSEGSELLASYATSGMRIYFLGFLFSGANIVISGYLSAVERPKGAFVISILRGFVAIAICSIALSKLFGFTGVWASFAVAEAITLAVAIVILKGKRAPKVVA